MEIAARNVNMAFMRALDRLIGQEMIVSNGLHNSLAQDSRNGPVLQWEEPVLTKYQRPMERVLFDPVRDANPFFHFFEGLWMLAGRNDVFFLRQFVKRIADYSDNGILFHGAYGHRARVLYGDQLLQIVRLLQNTPDTRRAVVGLWVVDDAWDAEKSRDIPCNTQLYFQQRDGYLNMTITNRSNDILWGAYGANAVHFSMIMEWVADKVGTAVGTMYQFSNNWHVYTTGPGGALYQKLKDNYSSSGFQDLYVFGEVQPYPMNAQDEGWDTDLDTLFTVDDDFSQPPGGKYRTRFFKNVVIPMREAFRTRWLGVAETIHASDWRTAAIAWINRHDTV